MKTYQRPWMVQESSGPDDGSVSQNCVCRSIPPGELTQQLPLAFTEMDELFAQLNGMFAGHDRRSARAPVRNCEKPSASMAMPAEDMEGDIVLEVWNRIHEAIGAILFMPEVVIQTEGRRRGGGCGALEKRFSTPRTCSFSLPGIYNILLLHSCRTRRVDIGVNKNSSPLSSVVCLDSPRRVAAITHLLCTTTGARRSPQMANNTAPKRSHPVELSSRFRFHEEADDLSRSCSRSFSKPW